MTKRTLLYRRMKQLQLLVLMFIIVSVLLGVYWFKQSLDEIEGDVRKAQENLFVLEDGFADAALDLANQTQEWKDVLLHSNHNDLFLQSQIALRASASKVVADLDQIERQLHAMGLATDNIVSYRMQHAQLIADYEAAMVLINPRQPQSFHQADDLVQGKDRHLRDNLRTELELVEASIDAHLSDVAATSAIRFWLPGLLAVFLPLIGLWGFLKTSSIQRLIAREDASVTADLRYERTLYQQTFEHAAVGIAHVTTDGHWLRVNQRLCDIVGYSEEELLDLTFQDITDPRDLSADTLRVEQMLRGEIRQYSMEKRYLRKNGNTVWVLLSVSLLHKEDGTPDYFISVVEDIQSRKEAERSAEAATQQYQALFEQLPEGVLLFNYALQVVSANSEAFAKLGYAKAELIGLHVWDIDAIDDQQMVMQRAERLRATGGDTFESRYRKQDGGLIDVNVSVRLAELPDGSEIFQCLFNDITHQKESERQIEFLAYHDLLTGLPNRRLLNDRLNQVINSAARREAQIALLYLDLDHFKDVNDTMGHLFGDELLVIVGQRLQKCIRNEDTLARIGGDEFVIVLNDFTHVSDIGMVAEKIISQIGLPMQVREEDLQINVSIGISCYPQDGRDAENLLKHADAALYLSKQQGRITYRFYTEELHIKALERVQIERSLHKALDCDEFELYYQPKVNLANQSIIGCEALIRWNKPGVGLIAPGQFIHVAEQSHLINQIGDWVIRTVCRQTAIWQRQGYQLRVAFNVSARQFMRPQELLTSLRESILENNVDPRLLELEMTESLLIDHQDMSEVLVQIRDMGIHLALDDFGTGYSSLSYLRRFPISTLKIDRSFICDADSNADDEEMVKTIIDMAHNLRMNLVAEGIETDRQNNLLCVYGCESGQGYFFGKPLPISEFEALVCLKNNA